MVKRMSLESQQGYEWVPVDDVFSFGMLVQEIVRRWKNIDRHVDNEKVDLLN